MIEGHVLNLTIRDLYIRYIYYNYLQGLVHLVLADVVEVDYPLLSIRYEQRTRQ